MGLNEWGVVISTITILLNMGFFLWMLGKRRGNRLVKPRERVKHQADQSAWEPLFGRPVSDWYRVWAWKPVHTLDRGYIWLRPYWRRRIYKKQFLHGGPDFWWQNVVTLTYVGM